MSLEEYKHEIEAMLLEASMKLTCAEYDALTDWLREEGLVFCASNCMRMVLLS